MSNKLYNLDFLNKISGGDENFIREMIDTFNEIAPDYLEKADRYLKENKIDALSKETHRFIPGVSFLGARKLEEDLMYIEEYTKKGEHLDRLPNLLQQVRATVNELLTSFAQDFN